MRSGAPPGLTSVARVRHDVLERLPGVESADLLNGKAEGAVDELRRGAADVRGDEAIGGAPERVAFRQRLRVSDINGRTNVFCLQGADEGVGIDDGPARGVDEQSSRLHALHLRFAEEAASLWRERNDEHHDVSLGQ